MYQLWYLILQTSTLPLTNGRVSLIPSYELQILVHKIELLKDQCELAAMITIQITCVIQWLFLCVGFLVIYYLHLKQHLVRFISMLFLNLFSCQTGLACNDRTTIWNICLSYQRSHMLEKKELALSIKDQSLNHVPTA